MTLLRKLFVTFLVVLIVPTLILMSINYFQTKSFIEEEAKLSNFQIVKQSKVATDSIISQTERISRQIAIDKSVQTFMNETLVETDYEDYQVLDDVYDVMLNFMNGTQYIEEISIYKLEADLLVSTDVTEQPAISVKSREYIEALAATSTMKQWVEPTSSSVFWEQIPEFHLVHYIYTNVDELLGFVVIKLKNNDFDRLINEMYINDAGMLFIADQSGQLILSSEQAYRNIIDLNLNFKWFSEEENYKEVELSGKTYFISLVTSDYNNWKYISLVDTAYINERLNVIGINMIVLVVLFILISLVLSFMLSRGIYNPIHVIQESLVGSGTTKKNRFLLGEKEFGHINMEITSLLDELKAQKVAQDDYELRLNKLRATNFETELKLHKYNFYRILKGDHIDEKAIHSLAEEMAIDWDLKYHIAVVDLLNRQELPIDLEHEGIVEFFYETDTRVVLLFLADEQSSILMESFQTSFGEMDDHTEPYVMAISNPIEFKAVRTTYEYLLKVIKYNLIQNHMGIIHEADFEQKAELRRLPYDYHTYLNNSLRTSSLEECKTIILELSRVIKNDFYFATNYTFYYKDVLNTIIGFLYEIQYINSKDIREITQTFVNFDERLDSIDKATEWMIQFIANIFTFIEESLGNQEQSQVMEAVKMIEEEYMDDLSLGEVAERLGMSVPYLSKQFKEEMGINFKDYLTKCKIEHAKQLLISSSDTVETISKSVGYNNTLQLVRMFKKMENITPTDYRKRNK